MERLESRLALTEAEADDLERATVDELVARLDAEDLVERYRAARELASRPVDERPRLAEALSVGSDRQRAAAAAAMAASATPADLPVLLATHELATTPRERVLIATALARTGSPEALEPLLLDLQHESRRVRLAAVLALSRLGDGRAAPALLDVVLEGDLVLSHAAAEGIRRMGPAALLFLRDTWPALGPRERARAVPLIGDLPGEVVRDFLRESLHDASMEVSLAAALELARRGDPAGGGIARARLGSDDPVVARLARQVLDELERTAPGDSLP